MSTRHSSFFRSATPRLVTPRLVVIMAVVLLGATGLAIVPSADAQAPSHRGDFNGDGFADLAIGAPNDSVGSVHGAGVVNVLYGGADEGLTTLGNQNFHQDSPGIASRPEHNDRFGNALAGGDFNGDGFVDLAIGAVGEGAGPTPAVGIVHVLYGSEDGLSGDGSELWHQGLGGLPDVVEEGDRFGYALIGGDWNGDGFYDLAIGAPGEDAGTGVVHVLFGGEEGLDGISQQLLSQDTFGAGVPGELGLGDEFGHALASCDFDFDGFDDLAVGVPGEDVGTKTDAGAVNVFYGAWPGLLLERTQFWHQDVEAEFPAHVEVLGQADDDDFFGFSLAAGDFDADGFADLAVGVPGETLGSTLLGGGVPGAGAVNVLYGFHEGLLVHRNQFWHQDSGLVHETAERNDHFGFSLAAGDFDGDGADELAVGAPGETRRGIEGAGVVHVFNGLVGAGLDRFGNQLWRQGAQGVRQRLGQWDQFGNSLSADDYNGDGAADLSVGVFNETLRGDLPGAGAVQVLYGSGIVGLTPNGNQIWHQAIIGMRGDGPELSDEFGFSLGR